MKNRTMVKVDTINPAVAYSSARKTEAGTEAVKPEVTKTSKVQNRFRHIGVQDQRGLRYKENTQLVQLLANFQLFLHL